MALLDEVRKLACCSAGTERGTIRRDLRAHGFSESQILEAIATAAVANFLNTLQAGLGAVPDFSSPPHLHAKNIYPPPAVPVCVPNAMPLADPDAEVVGRVQAGDTEAFEELVRRHSGQVFGYAG